MKLANIFQNGMVLQREKPIRIWGHSNENQIIAVWINDRMILETAIPAGNFSLFLPPQKTSWDCTLCVKAGNNKLVELKNIKIGEVWLAGGQSNMEFLMKLDCEYKTEKHNANHSGLFCYEVPKIYAEEQLLDKVIHKQGKWYPCTKETLDQWTAVGYYFAKKLSEYLPDVPIGVVSCNFGGSYMVSWLPSEVMAKDANLKPFWQRYQEHCKSLDMTNYRMEFVKGQQLNQNPIYKLVVNQLYMKGRISESFVDKLWAQRGGKPVENSLFGPWDKWRPAGLYEWMLKSVMGYSIRGTIWYQGEAEAETDRVNLYTYTMEVLMKQWHSDWQDDFPFLIVELAPFGRDIFQDGKRYPEIRAMQYALTKKNDNVYSVSIMDAGEKNNIHPSHKRPVGERLARAAVANIYGERISWQAPEGTEAFWNGEEVVVTFDNADDGLQRRGTDAINSFELICDGQVVSAQNESVSGNTVRLPVKQCPDAVRFAWMDYCKVNLYNQEGIAARPFQLDIKK